jgi:succinoglycan biosynthesis transport protein ExoP
MLQINKPRPVEQQPLPVAELVSPAELYAALIGFLRRQYSVIVFVSLLALLLGAVYIFTSAPRYTAHAILVIDSHKPQFLQQSEAQLGAVPIDSSAVDTQIEILNSENVALSVIKDLHLNEDPEFISPRAGFLGTIANLVIGAVNAVLPSYQTANEPSAELQIMQRALRTFQSRLNVKRIGLSYAIEIDFDSLNPERAAQITNAIADAYVVDALEAKYQITRRAAVWLQDRLKELREQSSEAERAVVAYKTKNNIVDTGGELMNEQQLAELNSDLIQARAATAEAKARFDRVQQIMVSGDVDPDADSTATVADTLHNDVITKLREQYLEIEARASLWAAKYGPNHLAVVNLRNQLGELRRSVFEELKRTAQTYESDFEIAKKREDSIQKSLSQIVTESQTTNEAQVTLHNLQSNAQTYRAIYDNFLQRYMESVQQQSFPISDSRVITQATPPLNKSSPKTMIIMALAAFSGLIFGAGIGVLRDIADRVFRTTAQVREHLQVDCIAVVPEVKDGVKPTAPAPISSAPRAGSGSSGGKAGRTSSRSARAAAKDARKSSPREIVRDASVRWTVVDSPLSRFTEAIRAIKIAVDLAGTDNANKIIGIASSIPNEGKSTIALSLAQLIAHSGGRAILVDCDLRKPALSRALTPDAKAGFIEIVAGKATFEDVLWVEPTTGLAFLPTVLPSRVVHTSEILASDATRKMFERLREAYDYVIVDLSPLAPVVDVRVMTPLIDSFVFVVDWGRTKIDVVEHALSTTRGVCDNMLGIVLNKVDMNAFGRYESYHGSYYDSRYYAHYGYTD